MNPLNVLNSFLTDVRQPKCSQGTCSYPPLENEPVLLDKSPIPTREMKLESSNYPPVWNPKSELEVKI